MRQTIGHFRFYLAIGILALTCSGADKWMEHYTSWTTQQADQVLNASPWARVAGAFIVIPKADPELADIQRVRPANEPAANPTYASDSHGVDDGNWDGGVGKLKRGQPPTIPVRVRWDSALPIRAALLKTEAPELTDTANTLNKPDKDYVIAVMGLVPARRKPDPDKDSEENAADLAASRLDLNAIRTGLRNQARLLRKYKQPIVPEDVHLDEATGLLQIYFPKTDPIVLDDKEVSFTTTYGTLKVVQRFRLKDMLYNGKLEL